MASVRASAVAGVCAGLVSFVFGWASASTNDIDSALRAAWTLLHQATFVQPRSLAVPGEAVRTAGGWLSDRPLGMIFASLPGEVVPSSPSRFGVFLVAVVLSSATAALLWWVFGVRALLALLGCPLLYVADRSLWPEAVGCAGLAVVLAAGHARGVVGFSGSGPWPRVSVAARPGGPARSAAAGWAVAAAGAVLVVTLCRAPLGFTLATVAVLLLGRRGLLAVVASGLALVVLVVYAHALFGTWSLAGGYTTPHRVQLGGLVVGLFSPARGVLVWSPWLLMVRPRSPRQWGLAAGLVGYTVAVWLGFDAWGGTGWAGYRYAVPLAVGVVGLVELRSLLARVLVGWSVGLGVVLLVAVRFVVQDRNALALGAPPAVLFVGAVGALLGALSPAIASGSRLLWSGVGRGDRGLRGASGVGQVVHAD